MKDEIGNKKTDLCDNCRSCFKVSGYGREMKYCRSLLNESFIRFPVEKCTAYEAKGGQTLYELEQMAIYVEKKKDSAGFRFYKQTGGNDKEIQI